MVVDRTHVQNDFSSGVVGAHFSSLQLYDKYQSGYKFQEETSSKGVCLFNHYTVG
jgi:hypothetical protein